MFWEDKPVQRGRPTKFTKVLAERIGFLARSGHTDKEVCWVLSVAESTFNSWKKSEVFYEQLRECKQAFDAKVEQSLLRLALGDSAREEKIFRSRDGAVTHTVETRREALPDFHAVRFWLMNRQRERWGGAVHCECHRFPAASSNGAAASHHVGASNGNGRL